MNFYRMLCILTICLFTGTAKSQYNYIEFESVDYPELVLKQIDQYDFSTVIHFSYVNRSSMQLSGSQDIKIIQNGSEKALLNSYNLPLDEKCHIFNDRDETLNFSLEFEKIGNLSDVFSLSSNNSNKFNIDDIKIDTLKKSIFQNVDAFISQTPSREYYVFFHEGYPVLKYAYKGIIVAIKMTYSDTYGTYFQPQMTIQNYNNKDILIDPSVIQAQYGNSGKYYTASVIDYRQYINMIKKKQKSQLLITGLAEGIAAVSAGYSYISSNSNTYVTSSGRSLGYGFFGGNMYAGVSNSISAGKAFSNHTSTSVNLGNIYMASQYAKQNIDNLKANQVEKLNTLQGGYVKLNTIFPETDYTSYFNIPFAKNVDSMLLKLVINGAEFFFEWDKKQIEDLRF